MPHNERPDPFFRKEFFSDFKQTLIKWQTLLILYCLSKKPNLISDVTRGIENAT
jgi:hypothetical protein